MAITVGPHASAEFATASSGCTTSPINTTGVKLIVIHVVYYPVSGIGIAVSDSQTNSYAGLTEQKATFVSSRLYYIVNPSTSASHTFTLSGTLAFGMITVETFYGASTFDQENGDFDNPGDTSLNPGTINPSEDGEVIVTGYGGFAESSMAISSGFTITDTLYAVSNEAISMAYLIQTTAAGVNPLWQWSPAQASAATIASFRMASASGRFFRVPPSLSGLGSGGPFFQNPLS